MNFTQRTIRSAPGLSQEEALEALYSHPEFKSGTRLASIRRKGEVWVANLLEPKGKVAAFPPEDDEGEEDSAPKAPPKDEAPDDDGSDGSDSDSESKPPKKKDGGGEGEVLKLLHVLLDALGIAPPGLGPEGPGGPPGGPGGPGGPPPGAGGPPPPHGGPPGGMPPGAGGPPPGGGGQPYGSKLKPGEVPNRPGQVPVGAPAFGSVQKQAEGFGLMDTLPQQPGAQGVPPIVPPQGQGVLPPAGGPGGMAGDPANAAQVNQATNPVVNGQPGQPANILPPQGAPGAPGMPGVGTLDTGLQQPLASFVASHEDPKREIKLATAKKNLEELYADAGYKVKQIRRDGSYIRALLSNR